MDMCIASGGHGEQLRSLMKAGNVTDLSTPITRDIDIDMLPVNIQHLLQDNLVRKLFDFYHSIKSRAVTLITAFSCSFKQRKIGV